MAFAKKKILTSALGTAEPYAYIAKPDFGQGSFKNERGVYKVSLTIPNDKCQGMIDAIVAAHEENYERLVAEYEENPPKAARGKKPLEPYEGDMPFFDNDDGTTTFNFKCYGSFTDKKTGENKPINLVVVDSKGKKIKDVPIIGGGSKLKVKFSLVPYGWSKVAGASVKLQLESVMLVELATFGGESDDWADEVEEGGYEASESPRKPRSEEVAEGGWTPEEDEEDADDDDDGDF